MLKLCEILVHVNSFYLHSVAFRYSPNDLRDPRLSGRKLSSPFDIFQRLQVTKMKFYALFKHYSSTSSTHIGIFKTHLAEPVLNSFSTILTQVATINSDLFHVLVDVLSKSCFYCPVARLLDVTAIFNACAEISNR